MKPYPAYKPSGVDWLGDVPEGWEVKRLGMISEELQTGPFGSQIHTEDYISEGIPLINPSNIVDGQIAPDEEISVSEETALRLGSHALLPGDIVLARRGELGRCAIVPENSPPLLCGTGSLRLRPKKELALPIFIAECIRTPRVREWLSLQSVGSTMDNLNAAIASRIQIPLPPLAEQRAIAGFLEREVGKIDDLVAETRRLIALLAEKRQATISAAVTRGLTPDAPLKPSGVDWLGDIPEGWEVVPLKHLVSFSSGGTPSKERLDFWDGELPWASAKDLKSEYLTDTLLHITETAILEGAAVLEPAGSVLVLVRGMTLAKAFPVCLTACDMAINQDLKALRAGPRISNEFLAYSLRGLEAESLSRIDEAGHGTKALRMEAWTSMELALPPLAEQGEIVARLRQDLPQLDALTATASEAIALLLERRAALISAAVTGKIDVRDFHAQDL